MEINVNEDPGKVREIDHSIIVQSKGTSLHLKQELWFYIFSI